MDNFHSLLIIAVMVIVTFALRVVPFILFDRGREPAKLIVTLGKLLPPAIMSVLVVYCIRNVSILGGNHGIPELAGIVTAIVLHAWKRNVLLSICISTAVYMLIIRFI